MIPLALLLAALALPAHHLWPPRGGGVDVCTRSCIWDGPPFGVRCLPAERTADGCRGVAWQHRRGAGNTTASLAICYRPEPQGLEWCDYWHPPAGTSGPMRLILGPAPIFTDGFESGDAGRWSG